MSNLKVAWVDHGFWPQCEPDPDYPDGIDLDMSRGCDRTCATALPYPAKRCGHYMITCPSCGLKTAVTTAGRRDDPRFVRVACKLQT